MLDSKNIVFFDGVCNLCNGLVDFLIKRDERNQLHFASLQGNTSEKLLDSKLASDLNTIIYYRSGKLYFKSSAILNILIDIGGAWKMVGIFKIIPSPIRDWIYNLVAKNRYRIWGQRNTCRVPTDSEAGKLLD